MRVLNQQGIIMIKITPQEMIKACCKIDDFHLLKCTYRAQTEEKKRAPVAIIDRSFFMGKIS